MLGHIIKISDEKKRHQRGPQMGQNLEADVEALASELALKKKQIDKNSFGSTTSYQSKYPINFLSIFCNTNPIK